MVSLGLAVSILAAGCTASTEMDDRVPDGVDGAHIYLEIQAPRSADYRSELAVEVTAPNGKVLKGSVGTHYEDYVQGKPENKWPIRVTGDVQNEHPGVIGPYPFMLFEDVPYNGTWQITVRLTEKSTLTEDAVGTEPRPSTYCARFIFSEPDHRPIEGRHGTPHRDYLSDAIIQYDWYTGEANIEPTHGDGCNEKPA